MNSDAEGIYSTEQRTVDTTSATAMTHTHAGFVYGVHDNEGQLITTAGASGSAVVTFINVAVDALASQLTVAP